MRITFRLRYHTESGQSLFLLGDHPILGGGDERHALPLHCLNGEFWEVTLTLPLQAAPRQRLDYYYLLRSPEGSLEWDVPTGRSLELTSLAQEELVIVDSWNHAGFVQNVFYTEPFQNVLLRHPAPGIPRCSLPSSTHTFRVMAPLLPQGQTLCILGSPATLGKWNTAAPILLSKDPNTVYFQVSLELASDRFPVEYKYGVYDLERQAFVRYEDGNNRNLFDAPAPSRYTIVNDGFARLPSNTWKGAGVAIPVFSLRSNTSFGIGEFTDLKLLVDWCKRTGLKLIQVLPVNDTTATHAWIDSYPYAAISAFALHPIYLNLTRVLGDGDPALRKSLQDEQVQLNALNELDYELVLKAKFRLARRIFASQKAQTFQSDAYQRYFEGNRHWLIPYAAFCALRDRYTSADFTQWPAYQVGNPQTIAELAAPGSAIGEEMSFHYFIQYHLYLQLREASEYAHANGIILKGDIAIGVARYGVDTWQRPELFHHHMQAGAPPDAFATKGQNWGFPTYNWARMQEDGYAWWRQRFEQMAQYFDAFRIDHILGFFRIWSIPLSAVEGILGYFVPALPVKLSEFSSRRVSLSLDRWTKPHITDKLLEASFGPAHATLKARFLEREPAGTYRFRPEFSTQRQIEEHFAKLDATDPMQKFKLWLNDLASNVILLKEGDNDTAAYHFRMGMEGTSSFAELDPHTQSQFRELYLDYFFHRQEEFWRQQAIQKLPALKRVTNLLICGEDLGMVPACVPDVMKQLGLLSLEVQRMPKVLHREFSRPQDAPYLSVVTPSTHDMSTIRSWWQEDRTVTERFYRQELGGPGAPPMECTPALNRAILVQHLASPAIWSIFQLQDLLGMDEALRHPDPHKERINVPANPKHYWRYRMHLSLEELLQSESFNRDLGALIKAQSR